MGYNRLKRHTTKAQKSCYFYLTLTASEGRGKAGRLCPCDSDLDLFLALRECLKGGASRSAVICYAPALPRLLQSRMSHRADFVAVPRRAQANDEKHRGGVGPVVPRIKTVESEEERREREANSGQGVDHQVLAKRQDPGRAKPIVRHQRVDHECDAGANRQPSCQRRSTPHAEDEGHRQQAGGRHIVNNAVEGGCEKTDVHGELSCVCWFSIPCACVLRGRQLTSSRDIVRIVDQQRHSRVLNTCPSVSMDGMAARRPSKGGHRFHALTNSRKTRTMSWPAVLRSSKDRSRCGFTRVVDRAPPSWDAQTRITDSRPGVST